MFLHGQGGITVSEIHNEEIKFNIKNRKFSIKKADFKENKKEQFLFDYLTNNSSNKTTKSDNKIVSIHMLDKAECYQGIITQADILLIIWKKSTLKCLKKILLLKPFEI